MRSKINSLINIENLKEMEENKYLDFKSSRIKASDLAQHFSAFANAEGGVLILGVNDKTRELEGTNFITKDKFNDFLSSYKEYCSPMPKVEVEILEFINKESKKDKIILFHIMPETERVIRTNNGTTYLRIADRSKELRGEDLINLEYAKNTRRFEDEINIDVTLEDLDGTLLEKYKEKIHALDLPNEQVLKARGFLIQKEEKQYLTNAGALLFSKNILQFYPNCRVRFIRYDGSSMQVGKRINIIKDINIEDSILKIIPKVKEVISAQLREFTSLDENTGEFISNPEYPEFAWLEGVVNAITHREYSRQGNFILISMYDDRLEIESPGRLPNIVTIENIKETRYSRNPRIARVLTEFGWVRELNEGVKRIYEDMEASHLSRPEYSEPNNNVKLVLKNNILARRLDRGIELKNILRQQEWIKFDEIERKIILYILEKERVTRQEIENEIKKSTSTVNRKIKKLIENKVLMREGRKILLAKNR